MSVFRKHSAKGHSWASTTHQETPWPEGWKSSLPLLEHREEQSTGLKERKAQTLNFA